MTCRELIRFTSERLLSAGVPDPVNDAALMLSYLTGIPALRLRMDETYVPNQNVLDAYEELVLKRMSRIPLQYLLHEAPFFRRVFRVDPRVLIPRPETELLCEWSVEVLKAFDFPRVLDLCCGSGCIGLTLKAEIPDSSVTLSDISGDALSLAAENARRLNVAVSFCRSDLLEAFSGSVFDLVVCNPPYIPSMDCDVLQEVMREPRLALDGGPDGLSFYRRIIPDAFRILSPGGSLLMELGAGEDAAVAAMLKEQRYVSVQTREDLSGIRRMIRAVRP